MPKGRGILATKFMSFLVVGKGLFTKDDLMDQLNIPLTVIDEAKKGRTVYGQYKILVVK